MKWFRIYLAILAGPLLRRNPAVRLVLALDRLLWATGLRPGPLNPPNPYRRKDR